MNLAMTPLQKLAYMIEGMFIDHSKTRAIHDMRNEITVLSTNIQISARQQQKAVRNTTAYKVAKYTGNI